MEHVPYMGEMIKTHTELYLDNLKEPSHLKIIGVNGKIILNWILNK
jgi:hypothetical protein